MAKWTHALLVWTIAVAATVVAGVGLVGGGPAAAWTVTDTTSVPNPPADIFPFPTWGSATCGQAKTTYGAIGDQACDQQILAAVDNARASLGLPAMVLPVSYEQMTLPEQLLTLVDLERVAEGIAPVAGLVTSLDTAALAGAQANGDPVVTNSEAPGFAYYTGAWAGSTIGVLQAFYEWMYDDGYDPGWPADGNPTWNIDCTSASAPGCWGHREALLMEGADVTCPSCTIYMGAASATVGGQPSTAADEVATTATTTTPYYTWAQDPANPANAATAGPDLTPIYGTTTTVSSNSASVSTGGNLVFTAKVASPAGGAPQGTVTWQISDTYDYANSVCTSTTPLSGGTATCTVANAQAHDTYWAYATFTDTDGAYVGSNGSVEVKVAPAPSTTVVTDNAANVTTGGNLVFTANVASPGGGAPQGTVSWQVSDASGTVPCTSTTPLTATSAATPFADDTATCTVTDVQATTYTAAATFVDTDGNYLGSSATAGPIVVSTGTNTGTNTGTSTSTGTNTPVGSPTSPPAGSSTGSSPGQPARGDQPGTTTVPTPAPAPAPAPPSQPQGYELFDSTGGVHCFGALSCPTSGSSPTPVSAATADPTGGYWTTNVSGVVHAVGGAQWYGSLPPSDVSAPVVAITPAAAGHGYWLAASNGGVFAFGDAQFHGSMGGSRLNQPIVAMAADPATGGYWLVASDGGVFAFDAPFYGSTGSIALDKPIVGMAPTADGRGYWLVASDGGVFAFGDAQFHGSMGGKPLNKPVIAIRADQQTGGYWLIGADGGVFAFDAPFVGSAAATNGSGTYVH